MLANGEQLTTVEHYVWRSVSRNDLLSKNQFQLSATYSTQVLYEKVCEKYLPRVFILRKILTGKKCLINFVWARKPKISMIEWQITLNLTTLRYRTSICRRLVLLLLLLFNSLLFICRLNRHKANHRNNAIQILIIILQTRKSLNTTVCGPV
jgi:hypothetical protein